MFASGRPKSSRLRPFLLRGCFFARLRLQGGIPPGQRLTDLIRRIFLDEVQTAHAHLGLMG